MRFRFCGDLDCPDWILAEINTLSKLSSVKMKMLCQIVAASLCGEELNEEKAKKLTADSKLDRDAVKACVSVLSHILSSSARYGVESEVLGHELEQLGLPKEHVIGLCKVYKEHVSGITAKLSTQILRLSLLENVNCQTDSSLETGPWEQPGARMDLQIRNCLLGSLESHSVSLSPPQLAALLSDMRAVKKLMDSSLHADADRK